MEIALTPELCGWIEERVKSGQYVSPEDVVAAALRMLDQQERVGDFAAGELDALLAEGEQSIQSEGTLDGDEAFQQRQARRGQLPKQAT